MTPNSNPVSVCPSCGARAEGRFCSQCGTPVDGATCAGCRATLTPGASYCHRCGTPAGATATTVETARGAGAAHGNSNALPWAFAAIALLAFGAYVAAQHFSAQRQTGGQVAAAPMVGPFQDGAMAGNAGVPAPDISNMSPEERADRLFNRIMEAYEAGNSEFVQNMSPMAVAAYGMLPSMDPLRRYDLGRIAEITGALDVAEAQADTLLQQNPQHLLGLVLAARIADIQKDEQRRAAFAERLMEAAPAELAQERPEYEAHGNDINIALTEARRRAR